MFGAGLGEEEDGEAEGLDACSRLATCRRLPQDVLRWIWSESPPLERRNESTRMLRTEKEPSIQGLGTFRIKVRKEYCIIA